MPQTHIADDDDEMIIGCCEWNEDAMRSEAMRCDDSEQSDAMREIRQLFVKCRPATVSCASPLLGHSRGDGGGGGEGSAARSPAPSPAPALDSTRLDSS